MVENSGDYKDAQWSKLVVEIDTYMTHNTKLLVIITKLLEKETYETKMM